MPEFEFTVNLLQTIPEDTAFLQYGNVQSLLVCVSQLQEAGYVFVVHPKTSQIAMSRDAAKAIGLL